MGKGFHKFGYTCLLASWLGKGFHFGYTLLLTSCVEKDVTVLVTPFKILTSSVGKDVTVLVADFLRGEGFTVLVTPFY